MAEKIPSKGKVSNPFMKKKKILVPNPFMEKRSIIDQKTQKGNGANPNNKSGNRPEAGSNPKNESGNRPEAGSNPKNESGLWSVPPPPEKERERDPEASNELEEKEPGFSLFARVQTLVRDIVNGGFKHLTLTWFRSAMIKELVRQDIDPELIMKILKETETMSDRLINEHFEKKEKEKGQLSEKRKVEERDPKESKRLKTGNKE